MIVTEYMENGSLDAFLRVCLSPCGGRVDIPATQVRYAHLRFTHGSSGRPLRVHPTGASISHIWGRGGCEGESQGLVDQIAFWSQYCKDLPPPTAPLHTKVSHATCTIIWEEVVTFPLLGIHGGLSDLELNVSGLHSPRGDTSRSPCKQPDTSL